MDKSITFPLHESGGISISPVEADRLVAMGDKIVAEVPLVEMIRLVGRIAADARPNALIDRSHLVAPDIADELKRQGILPR